MKKLRAWFKPEKHVHWALQTLAAATFGWMLYAAFQAADGHPFIAIFDAVFAGFCAGNFVHNILHRRRSRAFDEMAKIAEDQNAMLHEMVQIKSHEIAAEMAIQMRGEVSIVPPSPPTKH